MTQSFYEVEVRYNVRLHMRDGVELSANLWRPVPREPDEKFPAILEMIPYRKDDWRYPSDHARMTYLAERGFAGCRVDVRGTGSSQGIARDEYTPEETQDGYEVVEWLATQEWCNGNVGMWGISYGGFTAIQVAMLQPPHLKAIVPMYATDDRYTDDMHYIGGCLTVSELAQYAVSQVGMNAMPPKLDYAQGDWAAEWKKRLEQTPWLIEWLRQQTDGPYWRQGSLAPDYTRITCAIFHIGGWMDSYVNAVLRMQARCTQAAHRRALIGNWAHLFPDSAYPGPNLDWLHAMARFFDYWLKGIENGVMDEPSFTYFRREYTAPEPFPKTMNGVWQCEADYPADHCSLFTFHLGDQLLSEHAERSVNSEQDVYPHRPTLGTHGALCYGAGSEPNGLSRDLRPDEALSLTYTSEPLAEPLDILGFPEAVLYLSSSAPVAHAVVRLTDVHPDGTSSFVTLGILNLTHRDGHEQPKPLAPGEVYEAPVQMRATGYRFLPGHRLRLSLASAYWPVIWPSPYKAENTLHRGPATPSRLILPVISPSPLSSPSFKTTPPELIEVGRYREEESKWEITEDVLKQSVTVHVYGGDTTILPDGAELFTDERLKMTAFHHDPAHAQLYNEVHYHLKEHANETRIRTTGTFRSTVDAIHVNIEVQVTLNGNLFFQKAWLESVPRQLL